MKLETETMNVQNFPIYYMPDFEAMSIVYFPRPQPMSSNLELRENMIKAILSICSHESYGKYDRSNQLRSRAVWVLKLHFFLNKSYD